MASDKIRCPYCEATFDLDGMEMAEIFEARAHVAAKLGNVWPLANEYIDSYRQAPNARISLKKRLRHLQEIAWLWEHLQFEYDGRRYRTTREEVRRCLQTVCELEKYGFTNNNYLKKILIGTAQRISAEGMTAKEEQAREDQRREAVEAKAASREEDTMTGAEWLKSQGVSSFSDILKGGAQ